MISMVEKLPLRSVLYGKGARKFQIARIEPANFDADQIALDVVGATRYAIPVRLGEKPVRSVRLSWWRKPARARAAPSDLVGILTHVPFAGLWRVTECPQDRPLPC